MESISNEPDNSFPSGSKSLAFTVFENEHGPLTKRAELDDSGAVRLSPRAQLSSGRYRTVAVASVAELAEAIERLTPSEAICCGVEKHGRRAGRVVTVAAMKTGATPDAVARSLEYFSWPDGPGILAMDVDLKDAGPLLRNLPNPLTIDGVREVIIAAAPALGGVPMLGLPSASACLYHAETGKELKGLTGIRFYVPVEHAAEIPELGRRLFDRLLLAGRGFAFVSKVGSVSVRTSVDRAVWLAERLDFIGGASCGSGVVQKRGRPALWHPERSEFLTLDSLSELTSDERSTVDHLSRAIATDANPNAQKVRADWAQERRATGHRVAVTWSTTSGGIDFLDGDHEIMLDDGVWVTVDQILNEPQRFHERQCADPVENDYHGDRRIARVYTMGQASAPTIHSFAHGGTSYMLRASAGAEFRADSAGSTVAAPFDNNRTDMGNAGRFARANRDCLRSVNGAWLAWDGRRWARTEPIAIERCAKQVARDLFLEARTIEDEDDRKRLLAWAFKSESRERIRAMIDLARGELALSQSQFDADPFLLTVLNGTIELTTGQLREHKAEDHCTKLVPIHYDPLATCPRWRAFLDRIFAGNQELIDAVQRMVGYTLTGSTEEQVFFLLHGSGANGKSTFLEILRDIAGDFAKQAEFSSFLARRSDGPRGDIAGPFGARFVSASEAGPERKLDEAVIKGMTGGDMITARHLYPSEFEFRPSFKIWLATNHKPQVSGDDPAIWRRIRLIPFSVTIPTEERDPTLLTALREELEGILAWAVDGCLRWRLFGLSVPEAVLGATESYRAEMSDIGAFLLDCRALVAGARVLRSDLYAAYAQWNTEAFGRLSERDFGKQVAAYDPGRIQSHKSNGVMRWRGIELLPVDARRPTAEVAE